MLLCFIFCYIFWQCRLALKPDGLFLAAILGGETLKLFILRCLFRTNVVFNAYHAYLIFFSFANLSRELRIACTVAQMEREGGISPRLSPLAQVCNWLRDIPLCSTKFIESRDNLIWVLLLAWYLILLNC